MLISAPPFPLQLGLRRPVHPARARTGPLRGGAVDRGGRALPTAAARRPHHARGRARRDQAARAGEARARDHWEAAVAALMVA